MTLNDLTPNTPAIITSIPSDEDFKSCIDVMGIKVNDEITLLRKAPLLKDPLHVRTKNSEFIIAASLARKIQIKLL